MRKKYNYATFWFTGLSASGKSTLSEKLFKKLKEEGYSNIVLLDGEYIREKLEHFKYDTQNRNEIGLMKSKIALDYIKKGNHVIITGIAHHRETRDIIRNIFPCYFEVYLKCNARICADRDYKGNYIKALNGELKNFIGITEDYEESSPELKIDTGINSIDKCSEIIYKNVSKYLKKLGNKYEEGSLE